MAKSFLLKGSAQIYAERIAKRSKAVNTDVHNKNK
jgi:hypothetical protein